MGEGHGVRGGWHLVPPTAQSPDLHHLSPGSVDMTSLVLGPSLQPSLLLSGLSESHPAGRGGSQGPWASGPSPFRPPATSFRPRSLGPSLLPQTQKSGPPAPLPSDQESRPPSHPPHLRGPPRLAHETRASFPLGFRLLITHRHLVGPE